MAVWMQTVGVSLACFGLGALARFAALPEPVDTEPAGLVSEIEIPEPSESAEPPSAPAISLGTLFSGSVAERLPLMLRYVQSASLEDLRRLDDRLKDEADGASRIQAETYLLCLRWLELDASDALAEARKRDILYYLYAVWGEVDLDAALAAMPESDRKRYLADVLQGCAVTNPKRFADLFLKLGSLEATVDRPFLDAIIAHRPDSLPELAELTVKESEFTLSKVLKAWARHDPAAAQDWAKGLYRLSDRKRALSLIYPELAEVDPEAGKERYESLTNGIGKLRVATGVAKGLAAKDLEEAWSWASALPFGDRYEALGAVAKVLAEEDPISLVQKLTNSGLSLNDIGVSQVLMEALRPHAKKDIAGTLALLSEVADGISPDHLKAFAPELSQEALAEVLSEMPSSQAKRATMALFLEEWSKSDLSKALAFASDIKDPWLQRACCLGLAANETQPEKLIAWSMTLPDHLRTPVFSEAIARLAKAEPKAAYEVWQAMEESELKVEVTHGLISSYNRKGKMKFELLQALPIEDQPKYYGTVAYYYAYEDPQATSEWLATLPATDERDRAIGSMIQVITGERFNGPDRDFEGAFAWAQVLMQEGNRVDQLRRVVGSWKHKDEQAAWQAINEASLNEADRVILEGLFKK